MENCQVAKGEENLVGLWVHDSDHEQDHVGLLSRRGGP